jgi:hypothetical protein
MKRGLQVLILCLPAALACLGCRRDLPEREDIAPIEDPVWFRDDTEKVGLQFHHEAGPTTGYFMPQIMGSGAALLDFDNDGRFDLYFLQNGGPESSARNRLFHQTADGRFEDVSAGSGLDIAGHNMGAAVGDMDNDGWLDLLITQYRGVRLFRNKGNGVFHDVTQEAGLSNPSWGASAAFFDYDRDGWLDLIVVNYVDYDPSRQCGDYCHPRVFPGSEARLFHNRGGDSEGHWRGFQDVTAAAGLTRRAAGLGVVCADFDGDGWPDILAANDSTANHLWINRHNGTFVEEARRRGVAFDQHSNTQANMGATVGDVDGDGRLDLFITHLTTETHTLWRQTAKGLFVDSTVAARLTIPHWRGTGFGTILADFDLDGALDIAVVNGRVSRVASLADMDNDENNAAVSNAPAKDGLTPYWARYAERNQLFQNDGRGVFHDISRGNQVFCGAFAVSRGLVWGDFDKDGGIDLVTTAVAGPARFYRNIAAGRGHWLIVRARDPARKRDAYGAVVRFQAAGRKRIGLINPGQSYLCSGDPRAHFGLGSIDRVEEIRVDWPDGPLEEAAEIFPCGRVDRVLVLERGKGRKP